MSDRKLTDKYAMLVLNMRHSLGKSYDEIQEYLAKKNIYITKGPLCQLCLGDQPCYQDIYEKYWRQRDK